MAEKNTPQPNKPLPAGKPEEVVVIPPDYALKKAIGADVDLRQIFHEDVIEQAQQKVVQEQSNFLEWVVQDLATLEHAYRALVVNLAEGQPHLARLRRAAFAIKAQSGTFGYDLASQVARSLYTFCDAFQFQQEQCVVLRKHIDVLNLVFRDRIAGNGGMTGQELLKEIERLCIRFR